MENIDTKMEFLDMAVFDGEVNVQKAGHCCPLPQCCYLQGTKHVGPLFLVKDFKEAPFELLKTWISFVRFYFIFYFLFLFMKIYAACSL